ncbi:Retrovirus-related Pol polyprotein from transposon RE1 [Vitis vinifera]|uniref:Retrovirus-related Pol polyprotein from transposon RE1 n=1 Tax=Vitis vinifera TaxID=29760 RepID=A0A438F8X0_VITVI|nr:Retrovirus-related Pol polyprotein from transposon RE1 [Vitis vinifera]
MEQPPGFINATNPGYVCKLNKALHGLKQSPRAWYTKLSTYLLQCGFQGSKFDTSVFFSNKGSSIIILLIYVDDIIIIVTRTPSSLHLCQHKYIVDLLHRAQMFDCKHASTLMSTSSSLSLYDGEPLSDPSLYYNIVGALQYCTIT